MIQSVTAHISLPGLSVTEHTFEVPLDHQTADGPRITVFAREVVAPEGRDRPYLVYFQGGPGFEATRPFAGASAVSWMSRALGEFRLLLLDQRGTGRSTPVGTLEGSSPEQQASYLTHFRADSIVRDAEIIRQALGIERWSVLGQSFGGFCVMAYLSIAPDGLREALITGGVPGLGHPIDEVYAATYERVRARNHRYLERYPQDRERLADLHRRLDSEPLRLPGGDRLSWRRFAQVGQLLGMSDGAEKIHYLVELPVDSPGFACDIEAVPGFARNPVYAILHEASWADGFATRWSAQRTLPEDFRSSDLLTGEHIYPWMFDEYSALAPLREAAELLAAHEWPRLYDPDVLRANRVPTAAAVYVDDMYVERRFSEETLARVGAARAWITSEYDHNGLRVDGDRIIGHLLDLARGLR